MVAALNCFMNHHPHVGEMRLSWSSLCRLDWFTVHENDLVEFKFVSPSTGDGEMNLNST